MSLQNSIQKIVIVGGGTAGWMTAAALSNSLLKGVSITLIESEDIGTVGVGEATIPPIRTFNNTLGISENEFLKNTHGSFKLGIEFVNWGKLNNRYFHPFGQYGRQFDIVNVHQHWLAAEQSGTAHPLDEYCMAWAAAKQRRFSPPQPDPRSVLSTYEYAYHFDAGAYAMFLRKYSEKRNVKRIEGKIKHSQLNPNSGFIDAVVLDNDQLIEGELFIDCSGFRGLLIEQALKTGYEDMSKYLPCNRAWAVPCELKDFTPYTRSTAHKAGWQWRIPLQHRTGNGHVFSNEFISEQEALDTLMQNLDGEPLSDPRLLKFTTGRRKQFWNKNVVAIGLSSGFLEPLESTSIHLIQAGIAKLLALFPTKDFDQHVIDEYNRIAINEFEAIRDFLILHYKLTERDDSEMWRYCKNMPIPETLESKLQHFESFGRVIKGEMDLFADASWLAVYIGQGLRPKQRDPLMSYRNSEGDVWLNKLHQALQQAAQQLPSHADYIAKHCRSDINFMS